MVDAHTSATEADEERCPSSGQTANSSPDGAVLALPLPNQVGCPQHPPVNLQ
jgi:hypothetical protein